MGRPPCCDKTGVKKGPWTPEEDIVLVTYIKENGPGNWRAVPSKTGLQRCSKSCRLRWTNYLRPGVKRGNFTEQEEKLIVHLQALLGNRQRHQELLEHPPKKKLRKAQSGAGEVSWSLPIAKGQWERRLQTDIHMAKRALSEALSLEIPCPELELKRPLSSDDAAVTQPPTLSTATYASSAENISRLLQGWMSNTPKQSYSESTEHSNSTAGGGVDSASSNIGVEINTIESLISPEASLIPRSKSRCRFHFWRTGSSVRVLPSSFEIGSEREGDGRNCTRIILKYSRPMSTS
ncbi:unnamed protein product [Spirodela intermedia]|uniref:Uncharacterized protein n=1 Tax=Spirodela intermedia TaxID=51605 RepID=A0A7I8IQG7_SPIIN|nr:unnamed protein product [Spirodela intermedia]CAA6659774.1 unnamed protein product [Spirodela intermedia]